MAAAVYSPIAMGMAVVIGHDGTGGRPAVTVASGLAGEYSDPSFCF